MPTARSSSYCGSPVWLCRGFPLSWSGKRSTTWWTTCAGMAVPTALSCWTGLEIRRRAARARCLELGIARARRMERTAETSSTSSSRTALRASSDGGSGRWWGARLATIRTGASGEATRNRYEFLLAIAAERMKVSPASVGDARIVLREGTREEIDAVTSGAASVVRVEEHIRQRCKGRTRAPHKRSSRGILPRKGAGACSSKLKSGRASRLRSTR